jgi:hypothetical protein
MTMRKLRSRSVRLVASLVAVSSVVACGGDGPRPSREAAARRASTAAPTPTLTPTPVEVYCDVAAALHAELDDPAHDVRLADVSSPEFEREFAAVWSKYQERLDRAAPTELVKPLAVLSQHDRDVLASRQSQIPEDGYADALLRVLDYHQSQCG